MQPSGAQQDTSATLDGVPARRCHARPSHTSVTGWAEGHRPITPTATQASTARHDTDEKACRPGGAPGNGGRAITWRAWPSHRSNSSERSPAGVKAGRTATQNDAEAQLTP